MHTSHWFSASAVFTVLIALVVAGSWSGALTAAEEGAALRGVAHGSKGPVADTEIAAGIIGWAPAAADHAAVTKTDAQGRFELSAAPLGPIDVWARQPAGTWTFVIRMWNPGVNDITVDAREKREFGGSMFGSTGGERFSGTVKDKRGKVLVGAAVGLRGDDKTWVLTDEAGHFTFEQASNGDGLVVRASGYRDAITEVKITKKGVTVKLSPAKPTVVQVTDPDGEPLVGAWVVLGDPDRVQSTTGFSALFPPRAQLVGGWTDEKGEARVAWGHDDKKTLATAYAHGFAPASKRITAAKGVVKLQVAQVSPARAKVVMKGSGETVADCYVGLPHESLGGPDSISALPAAAQRGPIVVGRTGADGRCAIPHLDDSVDALWVIGERKLRAEVHLERTGADDR